MRESFRCGQAQQVRLVRAGQCWSVYVAPMDSLPGYGPDWRSSVVVASYWASVRLGLPRWARKASSSVRSSGVIAVFAKATQRGLSITKIQKSASSMTREADPTKNGAKHRGFRWKPVAPR